MEKQSPETMAVHLYARNSMGHNGERPYATFSFFSYATHF
jgi:hypothetical protein